MRPLFSSQPELSNFAFYFQDGGMGAQKIEILKHILIVQVITRPGVKYIEKYSNTLQLLSLINDYNYITITGPVKM